jgi:hypothetical protein
MAITDGDNNLVRDVLFEDICIDDVEEDMQFTSASYSTRNTAMRRGVASTRHGAQRQLQERDINRPSSMRRVRGQAHRQAAWGARAQSRAHIRCVPVSDSLQFLFQACST